MQEINIQLVCTLSGMNVCICYVVLHDPAQGYNHNNISMQLQKGT